MIWNPTEIRKKLVAQSKIYGLRMPQMQTLLSQERFLDRLFQLDDGHKYIWKGGSLILRLYQNLETPRFTVDIDLLARGIDLGETNKILNKAIRLDLDDGFKFLSVSKTEIKKDTLYGGSRFEINWELFSKKQSESLKIDICTGDDVDPKEVLSENIFLLPKDQKINLQVYPLEFIFAEKLETANRFFTGNTRFKDFIDMWAFIQEPMDKEKLKQAIDRCFTRRNTNYNLDRLNQLFFDKDFIELMEKVKKKNFASLSLPSVNRLFQDLNKYIHAL